MQTAWRRATSSTPTRSSSAARSPTSKTGWAMHVWHSCDHANLF